MIIISVFIGVCKSLPRKICEKNVNFQSGYNNETESPKLKRVIYLFYCFIPLLPSAPPPVLQHNTEIQEHYCSSKCHQERKLVQVHKDGGRLHQYIIPVRELLNINLSSHPSQHTDHPGDQAHPTITQYTEHNHSPVSIMLLYQKKR